MNLQANKLSATEKQAAFSLAAIFSVRLLGLFMVVPVFSLYAYTLKNATPLLIGVALGCYGLTQALLQIPFGWLSDRHGRKPIIALGLIIFIVGSLCAALSSTIWGVILGRSLQGAGAVGGATNALLADLTSEQNRLKAMAIVGVTIGVSFALAMMLGPLVSSWFNVPAIFWLSGILGLLGLGLLYLWVPTPTTLPTSSIAPDHLLSLLTNSNLFSLNFGVLILHAVLTATFVALPIILQHLAGLPAQHQWQLYLPVLALAFISMIPFVLIGSRKEQTRRIFIITVALLTSAQSLLWLFPTSIIGIAIGLWLFFTTFTVLEALLASLVSKAAPPDRKGTALGLYSCCQFIGIFIGGSMGGWIYGYFQASGVLLANVILSVLWLLLAFMRQKI